MNAALPLAQAAAPALRMQAVYQGLPQANRLTLSDFYLVPFHDDLDFESFSILGAARERPWPPVLLNYTQKYELMSKVLGAAPVLPGQRHRAELAHAQHAAHARRHAGRRHLRRARSGG
jgi:hypothetical protein